MRFSLYSFVILLGLSACGPELIKPVKVEPLPAHTTWSLDTTPKERPRLLIEEPYIRAYLEWFGGLSPLEAQNNARPKGLFDSWDEYLATLGLPDYRVDVPRAAQSNALMVATIARIGEALCVRAAERDFDSKLEPAKRVVFTFDSKPNLSRAEFSDRFDRLHRFFLSYPLALAPASRLDRFYELYKSVASAHGGNDSRAWAAVCTALIQHPEALLH